MSQCGVRLHSNHLQTQDSTVFQLQHSPVAYQHHPHGILAPINIVTCNHTHTHTHAHAHTHTHMFNGPFSGTTQVGRYHKGKTNLDFTEARDSGNGISWAICKSAPCSRQITMPAPNHSIFYRPDALPAAQPIVSKH